MLRLNSMFYNFLSPPPLLSHLFLLHFVNYTSFFLSSHLDPSFHCFIFITLCLISYPFLCFFHRISIPSLIFYTSCPLVIKKFSFPVRLSRHLFNLSVFIPVSLISVSHSPPPYGTCWSRVLCFISRRASLSRFLREIKPHNVHFLTTQFFFQFACRIRIYCMKRNGNARDVIRMFITHLGLQPGAENCRINQLSSRVMLVVCYPLCKFREE
jgi:hypothetical protein